MAGMSIRGVLLSCLVLAACSGRYDVPEAPTAPPAPTAPGTGTPAVLGSARSAGDFQRVARRVEPAAETICREEAPGAPSGYCDFSIVLAQDRRMPPNAFQTRGRDGRPLVVVSANLLAQMQSDDEIAFVLGHETAHHIAEHLPRQAQSQALGALILGGLVAATGSPDLAPGANEEAIRQAMDIGAFVGGRAYAQQYELEADWLGAFVTARAGFDPERGAVIFGRPALASGGGPVVLATHPASPQRLALVSQAAAEIRRQRAAGAVPRPARAGGF